MNNFFLTCLKNNKKILVDLKLRVFCICENTQKNSF